jgi:hypothetical protein
MNLIPAILQSASYGWIHHELIALNIYEIV